MKLLKNNFLTCAVVFFSALYPSITLGTWIFPTIVFAVLLFIVLKKPFIEIKRKAMLYVYLSVPFIVLYRFFRVEVDNGFVLTSLAYVLAQYMVAVQILHVISPQKNSREIIFFCSLACIVCAQDVFQKKEFVHLGMLGVLFFFYLFYINADWFSRVKKEGYGRIFLIISFAVFFTVITAAVAIFSFGTIYRPLEYYMVRMVYGRILSRTMDAAFLQSSIIGSIPESMWKFNKDKVNLRVFSANSPGYLKAKTYLRYDMGKWSNPENSKSKIPVVRDGDEIRYIINNREDARPGLQKATIFKELSIGNVIFTGKNPVEIVSESEKIERDNYGNLFDISSKPPILYHLYESRFRGDCFHPEKYMEIPSAIEEKLREKTFEITKGEKDERKAVAAILSYFFDNYSYELGIRVVGKIDPVLDFLYNKRKGHCEYFASSTVLLLRSSGVPARYVTGFLVNEKNRLGNYWVARNKDAHAWVEASLGDGKWTIVDSTPASAMPQSVKYPSRFKEFLDIIALSFEKIGDNFRRRGLFWLVNTVFFKTLAALVFAWYLFGLISKKIKKKKISCEEYSIPEELQYVRKKYYRLEKKLSRKGIIREPNQTLSEFLLKIKESNIDPEKKQDFIWFIEFYMFERYNT